MGFLLRDHWLIAQSVMRRLIIPIEPLYIAYASPNDKKTFEKAFKMIFWYAFEKYNFGDLFL